MAGPGFDPFAQNVTFLSSDGENPIYAPIPMINQVNFVNTSVAFNYGAQLGACIMMLLLVLVLTPKQTLLRRGCVLNLLGLLVCLVRAIPELVFLLSPINEFYYVWSGDMSGIRKKDLVNSVLFNTMTLLLVIIVEIALANQAWSVVRLWTRWIKTLLSLSCCAVTLVTVGWRFAFVVTQSKATMEWGYNTDVRWLNYGMVVTNAFSIFWYCAVFNAKLATHLVMHRRILPNRKKLTPVEALIMTTGILMIVPVVFAGLEWSHFGTFEPASLILTSVVLILPLGSLLAQRISTTPTSPTAGSLWHGDSPSARRLWASTGSTALTNDANKPLSFMTSASTAIGQFSVHSKCEGGLMKSQGDTALDTDCLGWDEVRVRIDKDVEQRVETVSTPLCLRTVDS